MVKPNRAFSVLLLTTLAIPQWDGHVIASPQTQPQKSVPASQNRAVPSKPPLQPQQLSWHNLIRRILKQTPPVSGKPAGARGVSESIYLVAPGLTAGPKEIYHDRPLLVWQGWQGKVSAVEVGLPDSGDRVWWSQPLLAADHTIAYAGARVQPGQTYYWSLIDQLNQPIILDQCGQKPFYQMSFQVIDGPKRDRITAALAALETELKAKGATADAIALERANYFADRQLWADALQEAFAVKQPSQLLADAKDISVNSCDSTTTKAGRP